MEEFKTGAVRDCGGKGRMDLLPMCALIRVSKHMEDAIAVDPETGKPHYPERNWEMGLPMHSMLDSGMRHLVKYLDGQTDEDHLCAAATNLLMAMWMEEKKPEMQDIPSRKPEVVPQPDRSSNAVCKGEVSEQVSIEEFMADMCRPPEPTVKTSVYPVTVTVPRKKVEAVDLDAVRRDQM